MEIQQYLETQAGRINAHLDQLVPSSESAFKLLYTAARYSLLGPGKRLRPILTLATAETLMGDDRTALSPACAIEMIHSYSLVHDDLPCMDNDDFRRGRPTLHKVYNEGHAVLTGDYLLTRAFEVLAGATALSSEQRIALVASLAKYSGSGGMIAGQVLDIESTGKSLSLEELQLIHLNKTAALIIASLEFGGIVAQASEQQLHLLRDFGQKIGLAFQIVDDVLDVTNSAEKHGKTTSSDHANQKTTYVSLLGVEKAKEIAETLLKSALEVIAPLCKKSPLLPKIATLLVSRKK